MTYLPPISSPITEYSTIIIMFHQSRKLAKQSNMSYTHITLDMGAAMKAFHVIWDKPDEWSYIIIHLGDFHAMMGFFGVIGRFVESSGFEDVLFQAGLYSSGSITGVMRRSIRSLWIVSINCTFQSVPMSMLILECLFRKNLCPYASPLIGFIMLVMAHIMSIVWSILTPLTLEQGKKLKILVCPCEEINLV